MSLHFFKINMLFCTYYIIFDINLKINAAKLLFENRWMELCHHARNSLIININKDFFWRFINIHII